MSAYRCPPPPPRWRVLYRVPLVERTGRSLVVILFVGMALAGLISPLVVAFSNPFGAIGVGAFGFVTSLMAGVFLVIVWTNRTPQHSEQTISAVPEGARSAGRCRVEANGERWTLPVNAEDVHVGQRLRVSFRELVSQDDDVEPIREIIEVRAVEE